MSAAQPRSLAPPHPVFRHRRLLVAALLLLAYPVAILSWRYFFESLFFPVPHRYHSNFYQVVAILHFVTCIAVLAAGIWLLTSRSIHQGEPSSRLRLMVRAAALLWLLAHVVRIITVLIKANLSDPRTCECLGNCLPSATRAFLFVTAALLMVRFARRHGVLWIAVFSACALGFSAVADAAAIACDIAYAVVVPPLSPTASAYEMLNSDLSQWQFAQRLAAIQRLFSPAYYVFQAALWASIAIWAGTRGSSARSKGERIPTPDA
jgi:hypothetical protein